MNKQIPTIITSLLIFMSASLVADEAKWSYNEETGPEKWASLSPDNHLCGSGKNQSPVNIDTKTTRNIQTKGVKFNYGLMIPNRVTNTGNLFQVDVSMGTNIKVDGIEFELKHLNFHIPSEHTLNEKHYPMEVQFVHESKDDGFATVSMMVVPGRPDRTLTKLLEQLPEKAGESKRLAANSLRNIEMEKKYGGYYRYNGSSTIPPCHEGVRWFIMKNNLTMSTEQYKKLKDTLEQDNNRPIQALNARMIME